MKQFITLFKSFPSYSYYHKEINSLVENADNSILAYIISVFATLFLIYGFVPNEIIVAWITAHAAYLLVRLIIFRAMRTAMDNGALLSKYLRKSLLLFFLGGVLWGLSPWLALIYLPDKSAVYYILAITFGITAASMATLSVVFLCFVFFATPLLLLQTIALLWLHTHVGYLVAGLTVIFYVIIYLSGKRLFLITHKNHQLTLELEASQKELNTFNDQLETRIEQTSRELKASFFKDKNTGLKNQLAFMEEKEAEEGSTLLLLDISDFSTINKRFGKTMGDKVLRDVSEALLKQKNEEILLFKGESDRYLLYWPHTTKDRIEVFCQELFAFFDMYEIDLEHETFYINFNIGIAMNLEDEDVLVNAELALEASKEQGSKHYAFFNQSHEFMKESYQNINLVNNLIEADAIVPYFQAIKDIKRDEIVKYEVLARGDYQGEIITPDKFLGAAKRIGALQTITKMMIRKSFAYFEDSDYKFSLNITEHDLNDIYLIPYLKKMMQRYNIAAERITFEILEHISANSEQNQIIKQLKALKNIGCKIAIDDFGVENSNFLRLLELDFDILKLDAVFIQSIEKSLKNQQIVEGIVKLAHTMGIVVVAEYVSNETIYTILKDIGVDYAQGFYVGLPSDSLVIKEYT